VRASAAPEPTLELLRRLKKKGYPLYCLSNMHVASLEYLEKTQTFWQGFDGGFARGKPLP